MPLVGNPLLLAAGAARAAYFQRRCSTSQSWSLGLLFTTSLRDSWLMYISWLYYQPITGYRTSYVGDSLNRSSLWFALLDGQQVAEKHAWFAKGAGLL